MSTPTTKKTSYSFGVADSEVVPKQQEYRRNQEDSTSLEGPAGTGGHAPSDQRSGDATLKGVHAGAWRDSDPRVRFQYEQS